MTFLFANSLGQTGFAFSPPVIVIAFIRCVNAKLQSFSPAQMKIGFPSAVFCRLQKGIIKPLIAPRLDFILG